MITCTFEDLGIGNLRHVVVDVLVLKNKEILLTKRAEGLLEAGKWGLIGGLLDRDETIEEGAKREVFEETGWRVKNLKLLKIIDNPKMLDWFKKPMLPLAPPKVRVLRLNEFSFWYAFQKNFNCCF